MGINKIKYELLVTNIDFIHLSLRQKIFQDNKIIHFNTFEFKVLQFYLILNEPF